MTAQQLTIPADNKPGALSRVTALLGREKINIRAITITSFGGNGFFHLVVDEPQRAQQALKKEGIPGELKDVLAVLIDDKPGSLDKLVQLLTNGGVNIENAYGFVLESHKHAVLVADVDKIAEAQELLKKSGFKTLDADSLNAIEPFHYMKY